MAARPDAQRRGKASPHDKRTAVAPLGALRSYLAETRTPLTAAALALPLLAIYGVGSLLVPDARNGADIITGALSVAFAAAAWSGWRPWAWFYGALVVANLALVIFLSRRSRISWRTLPPLLLECAIYAVLTGTAADWLTHEVLTAARAHLATASVADLAATPALPTPLTGLLISAGAGLHEELVFRLVGIGLIARLWLGKRWRTATLPVVMLALASSLIFAGVHHIVEPFTWSAMVFRTVAGLVFASLYLARGFAVAAWTHALYDVWILVVLAR